MAELLPRLPTDYVEPLTVGGIARQWHRHEGQTGIRSISMLLTIRRRIWSMAVSSRPFSAWLIASGCRSKKGRIALELEGAEVFMRNICIRELSATQIASIRSGQ